MSWISDLARGLGQGLQVAGQGIQNYVQMDREEKAQKADLDLRKYVAETTRFSAVQQAVNDNIRTLNDSLRVAMEQKQSNANIMKIKADIIAEKSRLRIAERNVMLAEKNLAWMIEDANDRRAFEKDMQDRLFAHNERTLQATQEFQSEQNALNRSQATAEGVMDRKSAMDRTIVGGTISNLSGIGFLQDEDSKENPITKAIRQLVPSALEGITISDAPQDSSGVSSQARLKLGSPISSNYQHNPSSVTIPPLPEGSLTTEYDTIADSILDEFSYDSPNDQQTLEQILNSHENMTVQIGDGPDSSLVQINDMVRKAMRSRMKILQEHTPLLYYTTPDSTRR